MNFQKKSCPLGYIDLISMTIVSDDHMKQSLQKDMWVFMW